MMKNESIATGNKIGIAAPYINVTNIIFNILEYL